jgi:aspartyl-tRNA(Asn)/glutamyl-tRNA(Gln) amidotransferase subunit A
MDERVKASLERVRDGLSELAARLPADSPASPSHPPRHPARRLVPERAGAAASAAGGGPAPVETVRALLDRVDRLDRRLGCYVSVLADSALAEARVAEQELAAGHRRGPLHGVPLALKDIFDTAGVETASGARAFRGNVPAEDAFVVRKLREAGAILVGKLNMHEIAYGLTNTNPHFGTCRNPWDTERVPGGSSGGSASALAAGLCEISLGTDTGGSIRLPAGARGIVGLKPTFGRVSRRGVLNLSWSLDHVGPMTRTVRDAAHVLDAIAGPDELDAWCSDRAVDRYAGGLGAPVDGLRIGIPTDHFFEGVDGPVEQAVRAAIDVLKAQGAELVDVPLPHTRDGYYPLLAILGAEASAFHAERLRDRPDDFGEDVRLRLLFGRELSATDVVIARRWQWLVREDFRRALGQCDVMAMPTIPHVAPRIGDVVPRDPGTAWNRFMAPANLAGLPAISVPCGFVEGLPVGLQITGRPFDETTVLQVAYAYEQATEWRTRQPPLA